jgi:hypothetical protein
MSCWLSLFRPVHEVVKEGRIFGKIRHFQVQLWMPFWLAQGFGQNS